VMLMLSIPGLAQVSEIRASGEYTAGTNDAPEAARLLAGLDARSKALQKAVAVLADVPAVKGLSLTETQLNAYVAGIVEFTELENKVDGNGFKSEIVVRLDGTDAARRFATLHQDTEASLDLVDILQRNRQLRERLTQDNLAIRSAGASDLAKVAATRQQTILRLQASALLAQGRFTSARHELGTASSRIASDEGRRRARELVERALAIDSTNPDAHRALGDVLLMEDQAGQAEKEFREVLKENPNSSRDHNKLGNAILDQGRLPEAVAEFKEAIRINPADGVSHADLGLVLRAQQDLSGALAEYRQALLIDPNYVDAHNYLGIAFAGEGQIAEALAEFREIIRIRPDSTLGHFNAATALADLEKDEESAKELRETVRLNPNHYNAHYNLGEMLRLLGELGESAKEFREYVNRAPDTPATQRNKERAMTFIKAFEEQ
jgi:tetratricopeptide (TPR) repeat protein